jgi:hypothetical protein
MSDLCLITASHSHLFVGATLRLPKHTDVLPLAPIEAQVVFDDHSTAEAAMSPQTTDGSVQLLVVDAYRTAAGTAIPKNSWDIRRRNKCEGIVFAVTAKRP